jgi:hypothetical protein
MSRFAHVAVTGLVLSLPLLTGCWGSDSSSGVGSLFDSGSSVQLASAGDVGGSGSSSGGSTTTPDVATLHNPEPASIALFGTGLAGLAAIGRRKRSRK